MQRMGSWGRVVIEPGEDPPVSCFDLKTVALGSHSRLKSSRVECIDGIQPEDFSSWHSWSLRTRVLLQPHLLLSPAYHIPRL